MQINGKTYKLTDTGLQYCCHLCDVPKKICRTIDFKRRLLVEDVTCYSKNKGTFNYKEIKCRN